MSHSTFFQQWHASLEAQATSAYTQATSHTSQTAGPSSCQERPSKFAQEWHAALEEQAQLALRAVNGSPKASGTPVTTTVPTRQREIQRLFGVVENELASAAGISDAYPLLAEWRQLQQYYVHLESQFRRNVRDSTTYLIRAMHVFHPDAFDGPDVVSANTALTEILRVVRLLQSDAKRVEYIMYDIQDEIEAFPARIMLAMSRSGKPKPRGLSKWLKKLRASLSKPVKALLKALGRPSSRSRAHIRLGSTDDLAACSEKGPNPGPAAQNTGVASAANCQLLLDALSDMVEVSQLIARDCDDVFQAGYLSTLTSSALVRGEYLLAAYHGSAQLRSHLDVVACA